MKRLPVLLLPLLALLLLSACEENGAYSGTLVAEGTHTVTAGETLRGLLAILGGDVHIQEGARVTGPVFMLGGTLDIQGQVDGDVSLVGGSLTLGPSARIEGDLNIGGGEIDRSPLATISGNVNTGTGATLPATTAVTGRTVVDWLARAAVGGLLLATFAHLITQLLPRPVRRVGQAAVGYPVVAGALGILTGVVFPSLLVLMAFTLVLIPVVLLGILLLLVTAAYGWIALGQAVGRRLNEWRGGKFSAPVAAFLGTLALTLAVHVVSLIPYLGAWISLAAVLVALGAVLLTGYGMRTFVPASETESLAGLP
jgi:cytoskeletal protein CcmA (bactofilin family)